MNRREFLAGVGVSTAAVGTIGLSSLSSAQDGSSDLDTNGDGLVTPGDPIGENPIKPADVDPNSESDLTQFVARLVKETTPIEEELVDGLDKKQYRAVTLALEQVEVEQEGIYEPINAEQNVTTNVENESNSSDLGDIPSKGGMQYAVNSPSPSQLEMGSNPLALKKCRSYINTVRGRSGLNRKIVLFVFNHRVNWCWRGDRIVSHGATANGHGNVYTWRYAGTTGANRSNFSPKGFYTKKVGKFKYCFAPGAGTVCVKENTRYATSIVSAFPGGRVSHRP